MLSLWIKWHLEHTPWKSFCPSLLYIYLCEIRGESLPWWLDVAKYPMPGVATGSQAVPLVIFSAVLLYRVICLFLTHRWLKQSSRWTNFDSLYLLCFCYKTELLDKGVVRILLRICTFMQWTSVDFYIWMDLFCKLKNSANHLVRLCKGTGVEHDMVKLFTLSFVF